MGSLWLLGPGYWGAAGVRLAAGWSAVRSTIVMPSPRSTVVMMTGCPSSRRAASSSQWSLVRAVVRVGDFVRAGDRDRDGVWAGFLDGLDGAVDVDFVAVVDLDDVGHAVGRELGPDAQVLPCPGLVVAFPALVDEGGDGVAAGVGRQESVDDVEDLF